MPVATTAKYSAGKPKKPAAGGSVNPITTVAVKPEKLFQVAYLPPLNRPDLPNPVGYNPNFSSSSESQSKGIDPELIVKRSWDIALAPIKQVPMNLFIMWMSGNAISIFPIMMVVMMFFKPVKAIISAQSTFKQIEGRNSFLQKLVYVLGNIVALGLAVYKCNSMGLLPTQPSDWLSFEKPLERVEYLAGGNM
ncbi:ER membrane protein complex subunit 4-like [Paramacrobiotus metropolitanus]|uniref:ER membrane protein complex subunit 4-like n=1 Tax=Paramacrobiotus metropolitanus TaxID=2943436 RepID=UPI002445A531|nr:ER membrane protein complex subunit 4-like [Paramacrobiotus metropolitanus]